MKVINYTCQGLAWWNWLISYYDQNAFEVIVRIIGLMDALCQ